MPFSMGSSPTTKAMKLLFIHLRYTRSPGPRGSPLSINTSRLRKPASTQSCWAVEAASLSVLAPSKNTR